MEEFVSSLSLHAPFFDLGWDVTRVLIVAGAVGLLLGLYCRLVLGAFLVWGIVVGFLITLLAWVLVSVLALKWALILAAGVALVLGVLFYLDEQTPVTGSELIAAAKTRNSHLVELFDRDPDAADSIAETLNLGLDESDPKWPSDSLLAGLSMRVTRNVRNMLLLGFSVLAVFALVVHWGLSAPVEYTGRVPSYDDLSLLEAECDLFSGIEEEQCLLGHTKDLEARIPDLLDQASIRVQSISENEVLPLTDLQMKKWELEMLYSYRDWVTYRDRRCDTIKYLTHFGSGTGPFVAHCRLRMTFEHLHRLEMYGSGFPDYL